MTTSVTIDSSSLAGISQSNGKARNRITIRIDNDVRDWFRGEVEAASGGDYQTLINQALRKYLN